MFSSRLMQFFQYKYLKYLTVDMINDKYRIEGSEAAADDRLLPTQAKLALNMANTDR
jgi:hypothetical protein